MSRWRRHPDPGRSGHPARRTSGHSSGNGGSCRPASGYRGRRSSGAGRRSRTGWRSLPSRTEPLRFSAGRWRRRGTPRQSRCGRWRCRSRRSCPARGRRRCWRRSSTLPPCGWRCGVVRREWPALRHLRPVRSRSRDDPGIPVHARCARRCAPPSSPSSAAAGPRRLRRYPVLCRARPSRRRRHSWGGRGSRCGRRRTRSPPAAGHPRWWASGRTGCCAPRPLSGSRARRRGCAGSSARCGPACRRWRRAGRLPCPARSLRPRRRSGRRWRPAAPSRCPAWWWPGRRPCPWSWRRRWWRRAPGSDRGGAVLPLRSPSTPADPPARPGPGCGAPAPPTRVRCDLPGRRSSGWSRRRSCRQPGRGAWGWRLPSPLPWTLFRPAPSWRGPWWHPWWADGRLPRWGGRGTSWPGPRSGWWIAPAARPARPLLSLSLFRYGSGRSPGRRASPSSCRAAARNSWSSHRPPESRSPYRRRG